MPSSLLRTGILFHTSDKIGFLFLYEYSYVDLFPALLVDPDPIPGTRYLVKSATSTAVVDPVCRMGSDDL